MAGQTASLHDALRKVIESNKQLIFDLEKKRKEIVQHQHGCLIAKTVGTTASTIGTALSIVGVLGAPFTGGATLGFSVLGFGTTIGGITTNLTTGLVDNSRSITFINQIENLAQKRKLLVADLAKQVNEFLDNVELHLKAGFSENQATLLALKHASITYTTLLRVFKPDLALFMADGVANTVIFLEHPIQKLALKATLDIQSIHSKYSLVSSKTAFDFAEIVAKGIDAVKTTIVSVGGQPSRAMITFAGEAIGTAAKGLAVVGVVFQMYEIASLIKDWNEDHPSAQVLDDLVNQLKTDTEALLEFLETLDYVKAIEKGWLLDGVIGVPALLVPATIYESFVLPALLAYWMDPTEFDSEVKTICVVNEDPEFLTEYLIRYAIATATLDRTTSGELTAILIQHKNKKKLKEAIKTYLVELVKKLRKSQTDDEKNRRRRRDHVINKGVLRVYRQIITGFVQDNQLEETLRSVPKFAPRSSVLKDMIDPLGSPVYAAKIEFEMVATYDGSRPPDTNAAMFGTTVDALRKSSTKHMAELWRMKNIGINQGTRHTAAIKTIVKQMIGFPEGPLFMDEYAKTKWIIDGGNQNEFDKACNLVKTMLKNLYQNLAIWVMELPEVKHNMNLEEI